METLLTGWSLGRAQDTITSGGSSIHVGDMFPVNDLSLSLSKSVLNGSGQGQLHCPRPAPVLQDN